MQLSRLSKTEVTKIYKLKFKYWVYIGNEYKKLFNLTFSLRMNNNTW